MIPKALRYVTKTTVCQQPLRRSYSHHIPASDLLDFHKSLVEIESISGNEKHVSNWLASNLQARGYNIEKQPLHREPDRCNIFAWQGETRSTKVMLTSHIDTVPPFLPYRRSEQGVIFGRGAVDAKGCVAAQVLAASNLIANGEIQPSDVSLLYVVGEEVGGVGMQRANDLRLQPRVVIFGEPTNGKLIAGHKGILVVHIHTKGRTAHSGYPELGLSATDILVAVAGSLRDLGDRLPQSKKYGKTTLNLGLISGGIALGVVADSAHAGLAVRIAAGSPAEIQAAITSSARDAVSHFLEGDKGPSRLVKLDFSGKGYGPVDLDADVPGFVLETVNYGTDIPWLERTVESQKRYLYGPGSIFVAHTDHEALSTQDLFAAQAGYESIILHALRRLEEEDRGTCPEGGFDLKGM